MLHLNNLTLGEIATIEKLADLPIDQIQAKESPKGRALAALALIAKRRTGSPEYSWADAQNLSLADANEVLAFYAGADDEDDEAGDAAPAVSVERVGDEAPGNGEGPAPAPSTLPID